MSTSEDLILKHPNNVISNPGYKTGSDKPWARTFKPIKKVTSHTIVGRDDQYHSNFETGFMELQNDDRLRFNQQATVGLSQLMEAPAASGMDFTGSWLKVGDDAKQS
ncbi:hypothetical protein FOC4_g10000340 [Fusarium odoratissimum]|uniref:Uncharacterized protein n=1 Tax=Fusarium oxysporum f. sp. cubense (strain race 4) TaxID=2502994 RepID=N1RUW3_FUSC4|nr:hypothetical protein FOC4_g10000340 [Fusarium odoratissimum]